MNPVWIALVSLVAGLLLGYVLWGRSSGSASDLPMPVETAPGVQADEALRKRNAIFAKVFNLVPDTLTITRISDGRFVEVNRNWEALTGFTNEEAIGHTSHELGVWGVPEQRASIIETIRRDGEVHGVDVTFRHKRGHLYYNKVSASVFEAEGEKYMMLAVQDVTAQREAEQQIREINQQLEERVRQRTLKLEQTNAELAAALETLQRAKDELVRAEKMAALGSLVSGVAHELNTPIGNGLLAATTMESRLREFSLLMKTGLSRSDLDKLIDDAQFATELLVRNLRRAGDLVRSFKQVAVDRTSSQRRQFELQELVSETVMTLSPAISKSGCEVRTEIDSGLQFESYPGPLGQILDNLINNAMIHGFPAGQTGTIVLRAQALGPSEVEIEVRDDGVGIDPENLKRVFDPFFTTRLGQGGSGLGLHIVHNIVTGVLGGRMDVSSQVGEGAVFVVRLPFKAPESIRQA